MRPTAKLFRHPATLAAILLIAGCSDAQDTAETPEATSQATPATGPAGSTTLATPSPDATPTDTDAAPSPTPTRSSVADVSPCLVQDGKRLTIAPLRAVGTEPFWAAQIEGRCVTYSHPDDQKGTRVWTRHAATATGGTWTGSLSGRPFVLRTRTQAGCSDGMSDRRYAIAVDLTVAGEARQGCADLR